MTNFSVWPPEVNSALMFAGVGSGPMFAAAGAWEGLAGDLASSSSSFSSVTSRLAGSMWQGPASVAMVRAAAPYVAWLNAAATHAGEVAAQAKAAVAAESGRGAAGVCSKPMIRPTVT